MAFPFNARSQRATSMAGWLVDPALGSGTCFQVFSSKGRSGSNCGSSVGASAAATFAAIPIVAPSTPRIREMFIVSNYGLFRLGESAKSRLGRIVKNSLIIALSNSTTVGPACMQWSTGKNVASQRTTTMKRETNHPGSSLSPSERPTVSRKLSAQPGLVAPAFRVFKFSGHEQPV